MKGLLSIRHDATFFVLYTFCFIFSDLDLVIYEQHEHKGIYRKNLQASMSLEIYTYVI